jgi:hypothetical protein
LRPAQKNARRRACGFVLLSLTTLFMSVGTANAFTLSSSAQTAFDDLGQYLLLNGAHNWTEARSQNWGTSNGNGGGYPARLGIAVTTGGSSVRLLGYLNSSTYYPVQVRGQTIRFQWNFGTAFRSSFPIRTGFSQYNSEGLHQWLWGWSYGP